MVKLPECAFADDLMICAAKNTDYYKILSGKKEFTTCKMLINISKTKKTKTMVIGNKRQININKK